MKEKLLQAVYDYIKSNQPSAGDLLQYFKISVADRQWVVESLSSCMRVTHDEMGGKVHLVTGPFDCQDLPIPVQTRMQILGWVIDGMKSREMYKHRICKLMLDLFIETREILVVKDPFQKTRCQHRLFRNAESAQALRKEVAKQTRLLESSRKAKDSQKVKEITDPEGLARLEAHRHFKHLNQYHREDVDQIVSMVGYFFEGVRCEPKQVMSITARKLYHLSRELGWRRLRGGGWTNEQFNGELDSDGEFAEEDERR